MTASAQWSLTGNSISSSNFIGTTNAQPLVFKVNGALTGYLDLSAFGNVFFGYSAGNPSSALCCNVAIGETALSANTSSNNTGIGYDALASCTSGQGNTAVGSTSAPDITTGDDNTSVGAYTMNIATTGYYNCVVGNGSLISITSASGNNAFGYGVLNQNTASYNSAFGMQALYFNTSGTPNCAFGYQTLLNNTTGNNNVAFGNQALGVNTTGSENTAVGDDAGPASGSTGLTNSGTFGYGATVSSSNTIVIGNTSVTSIGGYVAWTKFSDGRYKKNIKENVPGLEFIRQLRPITYNLDVTGVNNFYHTKSDAASAEAITQTGFIAQEVEAAAKKVNYDFSGIVVPQNENSLYALRYADFVVPLVKAVQELSNKNDSLDNVIDSLKTAQTNLQAQINSLAQQMAMLKSSAQLQQNIPNPFKNSTTINYNLPDGTVNAQLTITDAEGRVLKDVVLNNSKGAGQAVVNVGDLAAGAYFYSLEVNGKIIGTKRMVLIK
jgi:hypothetical protein